MLHSEEFHSFYRSLYTVDNSNHTNPKSENAVPKSAVAHDKIIITCRLFTAKAWNQSTLHALWKLNVQWRTQHYTSIIPILNLTNRIFSKWHLLLRSALPTRSRPSQRFLFYRNFKSNSHVPLFYQHALSKSISYIFITILGGWYKLQSSSLWRFFHSPFSPKYSPQDHVFKNLQPAYFS